MKKVFVPTRSGSDWQRLLAKPELHWKKGASAMTAAAAWEAAGNRLPPEITALFERTNDPLLTNQRLLAAIPEWEVELKGGTTSSHTDVLALCRNDKGLCVIGVEAKVLEDFGPLVGEKRKTPSQGQSDRLAYLHSLLQVDHFEDGIRYQLLHRTASALLTAREFHARAAVMLVQAFECPADRKRDFLAFTEVMAADRIADGIYLARRFDAPNLYLAWCDGDRRFREVEIAASREELIG